MQAEVHRRRSIRLPGYDYSQVGAYFVTVCTYKRAVLFDDPRYQGIVTRTWCDLPNHYPQIVLDVYVVMPSHIHGIVLIKDDDPVGAGFKPAPTTVGRASTSNIKHHGLPEIVRAFKTFSAHKINVLRRSPGVPLWQRNYYEHVVRDEAELNRIREYINGNPLRWDNDPDNPYSIGISRVEVEMRNILSKSTPSGQLRNTKLAERTVLS
ncbi:MAG: hypothetical protein HW403_951 [Dehalococcoidia bacterium]|nr:hypothetical protein [Dehalococcoidia bacterium]